MERFSRKQLDRISAAYAELVELHPELAANGFSVESLSDEAPGGEKAKGLRGIVEESLPDESEPVITRFVQELVVLSEGRPAILIRGGDYDLAGHETLPDVLRTLLRDNRETIVTAIRGVGRIEVSNHPQRSWIGTGFAVRGPDGRDILVTNRHVAIEMAYRRADGVYQFVDGLVGSAPIGASVDLNEEVGSVADDRSATIPIVEVLHIEDAPGPDLAFMRLAADSNSPPFSRLTFAANVERNAPVAAIGYPARDTRETDLNVVLNLLGDVYNKKRLAPGVLKAVSAAGVSHDCSTLGGNSGSPIIDLRTGEVAGLHYGGTFPNPINHGVPAQTVADRLEDAMRPRRRIEKPAHGAAGKGAGVMTTSDTGSARSVTVEVPLRITVELRDPVAATGSATARPGAVSVDAAARQAAAAFMDMPGVVNVRPGLHLANGQYSRAPAIVVSVDHTRPGSEDTIAALPDMHGGYPLEVRAATAEDLLAEIRSFALEAVPRINYVEPEDLSLDAVDEEMFAVFHVSPDAGWSQLREFLKRTDNSLTIGLYNFSTDHVRDTLEEAVFPENRTLDLVLGDAGLDKEETDEFEKDFVRRFSERMDNRFRFELADGRRRLFAGHYHIKVAVRDSEAFWLSSGNWEHSNQPEVDPIATHETGFDLLENRNREWHAVVLNRKLAETFEKYIRYDLESYREIRVTREAPPAPAMPLLLVPKTVSVAERPPGDAKYFEPLVVHKRLRIQPLLTPDNFMDHVQPLVESATESIDLQNQTVKWRHTNVDPRFERFMNTLLDKHRAGVRVRFILRSDFSPEMKELLIQHGFEPEQVRLLSKCHTKGIVVDKRRTLLGSHNLSEHGAFANRDASLIVDDEEVAAYFSRIFQFDWDRASSRMRETPPGIRIHRAGDPVPEGFEVVPLSEFAL